LLEVAKIFLSASSIATDLLFLILFGLLCIVTYAQFKRKDFDLMNLVVNPDDKTLDIHKVGQLLALLISSWGFIYVTLNNELTEWFFTAYMAIWAGATAANTLIMLRQGRRDQNGGDDCDPNAAPPNPQNLPPPPPGQGG
jgi:hypothetical protein